MGFLDQLLGQSGGGIFGSAFDPALSVGPKLPRPDAFNPNLMAFLQNTFQPAPTFPDPTTVGAPQFAPPVMQMGQQPAQAPLTDVSAQARQPIPPQAPSTAQAVPDSPGLGDRAMAAFQGLTHSPTLIGGIGNMVQGLATGQRSDAQGMLQQQQLSTYKALVGSGVPGPLAQAATLNPEILKTIAPAYFDTAPKLTETGTDPITGQRTYAEYRPGRGLTPIGGAQAGGVQASGGSLAGFQSALQSGVTGDALYEHLPQGMASTVRSMIEGRMPPPSTIAMRSPATMALINAANAIDPTFDATTWKSRSTFNNQLGSAQPGSVGGQKALMGTSLGHLGEVADAAVALGNSNGLGIAPLGKLLNAGSQIGTEQAAKANKLNETVARFSGEVGKLYSGSSGGGVHEREETRNRFGSTMTPAELAGALEASKELIVSKLHALEQQRDEVLGPNASARIDFLGQSGRAAIEKIDKAIEQLKAGHASASTASPQISEGATATNSQTGAKIMFKGGQWVPVQ